MRLERVKHDVWDVLAIRDRWGNSVWRELQQADESDVGAEDMRVTLEGEVPLNGPPIMNKSKCRPLGDGIYEFKAPGLRVLWFYDEGEPKVRRRIICSHAAPKMPKKKFQKEVKRAARFRDEYVTAKAAGKLTIAPRRPE